MKRKPTQPARAGRTPARISAGRGPAAPDPGATERRTLAEVTYLLEPFAHAVRNHMAAVAAAIDTVLHSGSPGAQEQGFLRLAMEKLRAADQRLKSLLAYAQPPPQRPARVEPARLLSSLSAFVADRCARQSVTLRVSAEGAPDVTADETELSRGLLHLLTNALDAMPAAGVLTLRAEAVEEAGLPMLSLSVEDTGPGIPEEHRRRVVEPFHSTKSGADGMGLAYARRAARLHGGSLRLATGDGGGLRAVLLLPVAQEEG